MKKNFNLIIKGVGGQGVVTLLSLIGEAAFREGNEVKSCEIHGLSQRGGSVEAYLRWGRQIYSPLVSKQEIDFIFALEIFEALSYLLKTTTSVKFLINDYYFPFKGSLEREEIIKYFQKFKNKNEIHLIDASRICREKLGNEVVMPVYLLGYGISKKIIPLKKESVLRSLPKVIARNYLDLNIKAFNLGFYD